MKFIKCASMNSQYNGLYYYQDKKVIKYRKINDEEYESMVDGSNGEAYNVLININHPRQKSHCECKFAEGRRVVCKHMIATYFAINPKKVKEFKTEIERNIQEYEANLAKQREEKLKEITEYVNSLSTKELRKKLIQLLISSYDESKY